MGSGWSSVQMNRGSPSGREHVGGHPFDLGGEHAGRVEGFADDGGPVGPVLGEGLAGPLAGDQDAAAAEAEVFPVVRLARRSGRGRGRGRVGRVGCRSAASSRSAASRAASAARRAAGRCAPPGPGCVSWSPSGSAIGFGEVLGQVADGPVRVRGGGDDAGHVELACRTASRAPACASGSACELVERLGPGGQHLAGVGVAVAVAGPDRLPVHVDRPVERRPPQLQVGGLDHLAQHRPGDGAADRGVQVRGEPALGVRWRRSTAPCSRRSGAGSARTGRPASGSAAHPARPAGSHTMPGRPGPRCPAGSARRTAG